MPVSTNISISFCLTYDFLSFLGKVIYQSKMHHLLLNTDAMPLMANLSLHEQAEQCSAISTLFPCECNSLTGHISLLFKSDSSG